MKNAIARQLKMIDWDFPAYTNWVSKPAHWYPGTFTSILPSTIIESLTSLDDFIFDPYCGVGTSVVESLRQGRRGWGVDNNRIALLAAYALSGLVILKQRTKNLHSQLLHSLMEMDGTQLNFKQINSGCYSDILSKHMRPTPQEFLKIMFPNSSPNIASLEKWFHKQTLNQIQEKLFQILEPNIDPFLSIVFTAIISASMKAASSQTRSWGHLADNVLPKAFVKKDINPLITRRTMSILSNLNKMQISTFKPKGIYCWYSIHNWTSDKPIRFKPRKKPDLLITSPPYANAIDYILSQRLSYYLLGYDDFDIKLLCQQEIGARRKRFTANSNSMWLDETINSLKKQIHMVNSTGYSAFILPHKNDREENGSAEISAFLIESGWDKVFSKDRSIRQSRARQSWTSIKKETIEIFEKAGEEK